jgi:uncharacterized protein (DUF305 family)
VTAKDHNPEPRSLTDAADRAPRSLRRAAVGSMVVVAALMFLGSAFALGRGQQQRMPREGSAEAGFARDMAVHHAQAVDMAERIRERTDDPDLRTLAKDIALGQQAQIGQMRGWLDQWQLAPTGPQPPLAWMGPGGHDQSMSTATHPAGARPTAQMPGMVTNDQLDQISTSSIADAESLFLRFMIDHHSAGVVMARAALERTERPEVRTLATAIVNAQESEIRSMTELLAQRTR